MLFINTRPVVRAKALSQCLSQAGFAVFDLPLLVLQAQQYSLQLQQQFQQLAQVQAIVVVSPTAVDIGMQYLKQSQIDLVTLAHINWIAVGKKTADTLAKYGIQASVPELETSEGMLQLPLFTQRQDLEKIAFWRGVGGRQLMMQQCQQSGIEVINMVLYTRHCPVEAVQQFQQLRQQLQTEPQPYVMCISSEASWRYWCQLCQQDMCMLQQGHYLVLGTRLYNVLQNFSQQMAIGFNITQLEYIDERTVLDTLQQLHI